MKYGIIYNSYMYMYYDSRLQQFSMGVLIYVYFQFAIG